MGLDDTYGDALDPVAEDYVVEDRPCLDDCIEPGTKDALRDALEQAEGPVSAYTLRTRAGYEHAHPIGAAFRLGDDLRVMREAGEIEKIDYRHYVLTGEDS